MNLSLPQNIHSIISIINNAGFSAHVVGGCVRDLLMGRDPHDWDITTNAAPEDIKSLFHKTVDIGLKHGTVTVFFKDTIAEITTWRTEGEYTDHRRPDEVIFTESLSEDLARRDFTMNAIAYHPKEGLVDPYDGFDDIRCGIIRCVGDPYKRFSEDALRMLRAIRFSAQLDFLIEEDTYIAIKALHSDLVYVSIERIQTEVTKILESCAPQKLILLWETGLSKVIFPEIPSFPVEWLKISKTLAGSKNIRAMLLGSLFIKSFEENPAEQAANILRELRYDNETIRKVSLLIRGLLGFGSYTPRNTRRLVTEYGREIADMAFQVLNALDIIEKVPSDSDLHESLVRPAVSGIDLKNAGLCEGKNIGILLSALTLCLYERPELNDFDTLIQMAGLIRDKTISKTI